MIFVFYLFIILRLEEGKKRSVMAAFGVSPPNQTHREEENALSRAA